MFKLVELGAFTDQRSPHSPDTFKLTHYEAQTIGNRVVGIRLKCLLVTARKEVGARLYFHRRLWYCSQGGTHGGGVCMVGEGAVHGWGVCMWGVVCGRGCAWQGVCMAGGVCAVGGGGGRGMYGGGMCGKGCMVGEVGGGVRGRRDGHCSGRYASYWNAFLLVFIFTMTQ